MEPAKNANEKFEVITELAYMIPKFSVLDNGELAAEV